MTLPCTASKPSQNVTAAVELCYLNIYILYQLYRVNRQCTYHKLW